MTSPLSVTEDLHLDVACLGDNHCDKHSGLAEIPSPLLARLVESSGKFLGVPDTVHADSATAGSRLHHNGVADHLGGRERASEIFQEVGAGQ